MRLRWVLTQKTLLTKRKNILRLSTLILVMVMMLVMAAGGCN